MQYTNHSLVFVKLLQCRDRQQEDRKKTIAVEEKTQNWPTRPQSRPLVMYWLTELKLTPFPLQFLNVSYFAAARTHCHLTFYTSSPCFSFQILPSARQRSHPGLTAWLGASLRAIRTRRHRWVSSVYRSSSASTWPLLTAWCTTRRSTWPPRPPCPTWVWTWASRRLWARCHASRITSPCPSMHSRCGAVLCCRPPLRCPATTARQAASRTCGYAPSNTLPRSASTPCPTKHWLPQNRTRSAELIPPVYHLDPQRHFTKSEAFLSKMFPSMVFSRPSIFCNWFFFFWS